MSAPLSRRRLRIRIGLVAGILVSSLVLVMVWRARLEEREPSAASLSGDEGQILQRVRLVDEQGAPVPGAEVFVLSADGTPPPGMVWAPEEALLTLPASDSPRSLRVTARGFRSREVGGLVGSREIVMRRGLRLQVELRDLPASGLPETVRILLRIKPADTEENGERAHELIELMDHLGAADAAGEELRRHGIGYPVSLAQARAGILLPQPGHYDVHWGLLDRRQRTWYSLGDSCGRRIEVRGEGAEKTCYLPVTLEDLQKTLDGLEARVKHIEQLSREGAKK